MHRRELRVGMCGYSYIERRFSVLNANVARPNQNSVRLRRLRKQMAGPSAVRD
jgi:hypothetical protein